TRCAKRVVRAQMVEQLVQLVFNRVEAVCSGCRGVDLARWIEQKIGRQVLGPVTHFVIVVERTWLSEVESLGRITHFARIFLRVRLWHVYGDDAQSLMLALIA